MGNNVQFDAAKISVLSVLERDKDKFWDIPELAEEAHLGMWPVEGFVDVLKDLVRDRKIIVTLAPYKVKLK